MNPFGRRPNSDKPSAPPESKSGWRFWENGKLAGGIDAMTATLKRNPPSNPGNLSVTPKGGSWWGIPGKMGLTALIAKLARAPTVNPSGGRPNSDKPSAPPESKSGWRFWENRLPVTFGQAGGNEAVTVAPKKNPPSNPDNLSVPSQAGSWWGIPGKMGLTALFAKLARAPTVNPSGGRPNSDNSSAPPESKSGWRFWEKRLPVTFGLAGKAVTAAPQKNPPSNPDNLSVPPQAGSWWGIPGKMGLTALFAKLTTAPIVNSPGKSVIPPKNDGWPNLDIPSGPPEGRPGWKSWVKELPAKIGLTTSGNAVAGAAITNPPAKSVISPIDQRPKAVIPSGSTEGQPGSTSWVKELPAKIGLTTSGNAVAGPAIASPPGKSVISPTDHGRPNSDIPPEPPEGQSAWKTMEKGLPAALGVAAAGVAVAGAPLIISGVGFGAGGIAAGSAAASIMSSAATAGVGMGAVSALQSAGAAGMAAGTKILIGASAGAAAAKIAGVALDKGNKQGGNPLAGAGKGVNLGGNVAGESSRDKDLGDNGTERKNSWYSGWGKYFKSKI